MMEGFSKKIQKIEFSKFKIKLQAIAFNKSLTLQVFLIVILRGILETQISGVWGLLG